jgi:hypothetical protein
MSREDLLKSRGFRDEKHLQEFLESCKDESWKQELIEYFGDTPKSNKKSNKKSKEVVEEVIEEEVVEEEIPEETESEVIEEASEEEINEEE